MPTTRRQTVFKLCVVVFIALQGAALLAGRALPAVARAHDHTQGLAADGGSYTCPSLADPLTPTNLLIWPSVPISYSYITSDVVEAHHDWHIAHPVTEAINHPGWGRDFRTFHHDFVYCLITWREAYGYGPIEPWMPGPTATAPLGHVSRNGNIRLAGAVLSSTARPSYFSIASGSTSDPFYTTTTGYLTSVASLKYKLADYSSDEELAQSLWGNWHGLVHLEVGQADFKLSPGNPPFGDMGTFDVPPWDPLFFHWHLYVDNVFVEFDSVHRLLFLPLLMR
jgi:hypothetical protein